MQEGGPFYLVSMTSFLIGIQYLRYLVFFVASENIFQSISIDETLSPSLIKGEDE